MAGEGSAKFEIGKVVNNMWRIAGGTFPTLWPLIIGFLVAPLALFGLFDVVAASDSDARYLNALGNFVTGFSSLPVSVAVIYAGLNLLDGHTVTPGQVLRIGREQFLPAFALAMLTGLGIALGLILFLVPGLFLAVAWTTALPVLVMENAKVMPAMKRSSSLTTNFRWPTSLTLLIVGCIYGGCFIVLAALTYLSQLINMEPVYDVALSPIFVAIVYVLGAAAQASIYRELIRIKEDGVPTVADVFS
jgi:hypothetical protein